MKLSTKLILLFLILATLPLLVGGFLAYQRGRQIIEQNLFNYLVSINLFKEDEFNRWVLDNRHRLENLAQRPLVRDYTQYLIEQDLPPLPVHQLDEPQLQKYHSLLVEDHLQTITSQNGGFVDLFILRASDGMILVSTNPTMEGKFREHETYFTSGKIFSYVDKVTYSVSHQEVVMHLSTPIRNQQGTTIAVLVGHLDLAEMSEIILQSSGQITSEDTYLVNQANFFVTDPKFGQDYVLKRAIYTPGVADCLAGNSGTGFYPDYRGVPVMGAYDWLPNRQLCLLTEIDQAEAFAPIVDLRNLLLGLGTGLVLIVLTLGLIFTQTILQPVAELVKGTQEIGQGNLDYHIPLTTKDELGQLATAFNSMADRRQQAEQALRENQEWLATTLRSIGDAVIAADTDGRVTLMNPIAEELTGWREAEALGLPMEQVFVIVNEQSGELVESPVSRVLREGLIMGLANDTLLIARDGARRPVADSGAPIRDEGGNLMGAVMVFRDITHSRELHQRLFHSERMAVLGKLAASMSHELRNPLGVIKNAAYYLNMTLEEPEAEVQQMLQILDQEVAQATQIINDLLDYANAKPPTLRPVDLNDVLEATLAHTPVPTGIQIVRQLDPSLPVIRADPTQLEQAFRNLLENAVKAMPGGGSLSITSETLTIEEGEPAVAVHVTDSGVGIPEELLEQIFEPLFTTRTRGIGLGLSLARMIVSGHAGKIQVISQVGAGSTFTVILPVHPNPQNHEIPA